MASRRGNYYPLVVGFLAGFPVALIISLAALGCMDTSRAERAALLALNLFTYSGLAFGYFCFVNLNIASLRIRMLQELLAAGGSLPKDRLLACYNTEKVIALRISRLVRGRHLLQDQDRVYSGKRHFLFVSRVIDILRWIILGSKTPAAGFATPVQEEVFQRTP
ncbi:MAG: hypothetical protein ACLP9L_03215 [Thermoguttaceae bacterium]